MGRPRKPAASRKSGAGQQCGHAVEASERDVCPFELSGECAAQFERRNRSQGDGTNASTVSSPKVVASIRPVVPRRMVLIKDLAQGRQLVKVQVEGLVANAWMAGRWQTRLVHLG